MANVLSIAYFVVGSVIAHTSILLWILLLPSRWIEPTGRRFEKAPVRLLFTGLLFAVLAFLLLCGLLLVRQSAFQNISRFLAWFCTTLSIKRIPHDGPMLTHAIGWLCLSPFLAGLLLGEAGLVECFATRLQRRWEVGSRWWPRILGAFTLSFGYFMPIFGWFVFLPVIGLVSLGGGFLTLICPPRLGLAPEKCAAEGDVMSSVSDIDLKPAGIAG